MWHTPQWDRLSYIACVVSDSVWWRMKPRTDSGELYYDIDIHLYRQFPTTWKHLPGVQSVVAGDALYSLRERLCARGIEPASPQFSFHVAKAHFSSTWPPWPHFLPRGNNEATIGPYHNIGPLKKLNNIQPDFRISLPHRSHNNMILALSYNMSWLYCYCWYIPPSHSYNLGSCQGHAEYHSYSQ